MRVRASSVCCVSVPERCVALTGHTGNVCRQDLCGRTCEDLLCELRVCVASLLIPSRETTENRVYLADDKGRWVVANVEGEKFGGSGCVCSACAVTTVSISIRSRKYVTRKDPCQ